MCLGTCKELIFRDKFFFFKGAYNLGRKKYFELIRDDVAVYVSCSKGDAQMCVEHNIFDEGSESDYSDYESDAAE
jgi:hypothetical protein